MTKKGGGLVSRYLPASDTGVRQDSHAHVLAPDASLGFGSRAHETNVLNTTLGKVKQTGVDTPQNTPRGDTYRGPSSRPPNSNDKILAPKRKTVASQEKDAIDSLTKLHHREDQLMLTPANHSPSKRRYSPHNGKGVLKTSCANCNGAVAVKVSAELRDRNKQCESENDKICQKCYRGILSAQDDIVPVLKKAVWTTPMRGNVSFPWMLTYTELECSQIVPDAVFNLGDSFHVHYNYDNDFKQFITFRIVISAIRDGLVDLSAMADAKQYEDLLRSAAMRTRTNPHPGAIIAENERIYTIIWRNIPLSIATHCRVLSVFQGLSGTITSVPLNLTYADGKTVDVFLTSQHRLVVFPYENLLDIDVRFKGEGFHMKSVTESVNHVNFDENKIGSIQDCCKIVAMQDDKQGTVFMLLEYFTFNVSTLAMVLNQVLLKTEARSLNRIWTERFIFADTVTVKDFKVDQRYLNWLIQQGVCEVV